jgi:fibronectin-binding autotransporter adhesin
MSSLKLVRPFAQISALSVVGFLGLLASNARSAVLTENFDVNGATAGFGVITGGTYDWDDITNGGFWSNNAVSTTGATATNPWPQANFPKFQPASTPTYTVTVGNGKNEQITGIFASTAQTLTINTNPAVGGTGTLEVVAGDDGFLGSGSADVTINVPIKGAGRVAPSNGGNIRFNAVNTYTGGTLLASTSSLIHFNNGSAFGSGDMSIAVAGFVPLLGSGGATITLPNNFVNTIAGGGVNFAADANTPVISSGTWSLGANNLVLRNNGVTTSTLTLSNTISGSGGITLSSNNSSTIIFSAANTGYSGTTSITGPGGTGTGTTIVTLAIGNDSALGTGPLTLAGGVLATNGGPRSIANNTTIVASTAGSSVTPTDNLTFTGTFTNSGGNRILIGTTNTGTTTFTNSVFLSEASGSGRTLILDGAGSVNPKFVISGNVSNFNGVGGTAGSIQVGNGSAATAATLTLSGTNTHTGATNVSTGSLLNIGSATALGGSTLTATGNGSFDNTTGGALVLTNNVALSGGSPTFVGTDDLTLGNVAISGAGRTITVTAKTLTVNDVTQDVAGRNFTKGAVGTGKLVIKGNASYTGTTTISAGTLQIGNGGTTGTLSTSSAIVDNANLTFNRSNAVTQGTDFSGAPITGATGSLTKEGGGILTLTAANTYGGGTTVNNGKLLANNTTGSATGAGDVTVNTNGILGGTGTIAGNVIVNGGQLSPGASINVLSIGGNLSMTGGAFDYEINSDPIPNADLNNVTGNLVLAGTALSASDLGTSFLAMGTKFTLINYGGAWNGGIFTGLANHSASLVIGLNRFEIDYDDTTGGSNFGGGSVVGANTHFVTITAVPEASAFLTVALGGIFAVAAVWMSKRLRVSVLKA